MGETRERNLHILSSEPAIARIVAVDEDNRTRTYFISRATPQGSPRDGNVFVSYRSPLGRLASLAVGTDVEVEIPDGSRSFEVRERASLRPRWVDGEWDSVDSTVESVDRELVTVSSFLELLRAAGADMDALDMLDAMLAEDKVAGIVAEGLRRTVIAKMELRDQPLLDQYQDEIFRLPLDTRLVILGPPGTGKTTTLIKRLGLKLDTEYLSEEERSLVADSMAAPAGHGASWIMFTPTDLLKQYVKEAFARENVPASDLRIQTWSEYRRELARNKFAILRTASGPGSFVMNERLPSLQAATIEDQRSWFTDFNQWQADAYWADLNIHGEALSKESDPALSRLGSQLKRALAPSASGALAGIFVGLADQAEEVQSLIARLKSESDAKIRAAIGHEVKQDRTILDRLVAYLDEIADGADEPDAQDAEEEEDSRQIRLGREAAFDAFAKAIRAKARSALSARRPSSKSRIGTVAQWLGERGPSPEELKELGASLQRQASLRRFMNPLRRYIDGLPARYRRFRRERQAEGHWYEADGFAAHELHPLEVDIILLGLLRGMRILLSDRRIDREVDEGRYAPLGSMRDLYRTQVVVDEATDFSPVQLACMAALGDPAANSFVACGDFKQRMTEWGSRSSDDLKWVAGDIDIRSITITYRHSRQLNELARSIALLSSPDAPEAQLPKRVNNDGVEPVLGLHLQGNQPTAAWLAARIEEIEKFTQILSSIAVLVRSEDEVIPLADALDEALAGRTIRAVPCPRGQMAGNENDVRVFDVQHIKGLEFEAVFFIGVDRLASVQPALFDKYLYVGATRAAMYLGLTTSGPSLPLKLQPASFASAGRNSAKHQQKEIGR